MIVPERLTAFIVLFTPEVRRAAEEQSAWLGGQSPQEYAESYARAIENMIRKGGTQVLYQYPLMAAAADRVIVALGLPSRAALDTYLQGG